MHERREAKGPGPLCHCGWGHWMSYIYIYIFIYYIIIIYYYYLPGPWAPRCPWRQYTQHGCLPLWEERLHLLQSSSVVIGPVCSVVLINIHTSGAVTHLSPPRTCMMKSASRRGGRKCLPHTLTGVCCVTRGHEE